MACGCTTPRAGATSTSPRASRSARSGITIRRWWAISEQARKVLHTSNLWLNSPCVEAMELLVEHSFGDRVFFGNSGAEAIEASLKIARRYMQAVRGEQRFEFITANESFHGRTWAAISATGQPKYHQGFAPLVPGFVHVPYGDLGAVEAALNERTCAVMVEPIQGEGGIIVPPEGYLEGLRALCDKAGILLIFDEVQTGVGRTGRWFAYEHTAIAPDIMALAKGLGGGVPVGAMVCTAAVAQGFVPGVHASTFGGNPLATSAVVAVMRTIEAEGLLPRVEAVGDQLGAGLDALVDEFDGLIEARGRGLMRGLAVDDKVLDRTVIKAQAQERGAARHARRSRRAAVDAAVDRRVGACRRSAGDLAHGDRRGRGHHRAR
jgi:acetylornithine/N-succinyldiaminopimelate aminotransferase